MSKSSLSLAAAVVALASCATLPMAEQSTLVPGTVETGTPRPFAEGTISAGDASCPAFMPDGRTVYFMRESTAARRQPVDYTIMRSTYADGRWSAPTVAPFSGTHLDIDPYVSRDGSRLLFASRRPLPQGDSATTGFQMWAVAREGDGWSEPSPFGPPVDPTVSRFFATMTATGTLYFSQRREGGATGNDIYRSRLVSGAYEPPQPVQAVNSTFSDSNPLVSADERVLIFFSARPGGLGASDLYLSVRTVDGEWSAPRNLGAGVNSPDFENCPGFSPNGRQLFYSRGRRGASGQVESREIFYVSLDSVLARVR